MRRDPGCRSGPAQWLVTARSSHRRSGARVLRHRGERRTSTTKSSSGSTRCSIARACATMWPFSDGPHSWPPEPLMREGVDWFELQAMRTGIRPADAAWIDSLYQARLETGQALESKGDAFGAWQRYRLTVGDFDRLHESAAAAEGAARLQRGKAVQDALRQQRRNVKLGRVPHGGAAVCRESEGVQRAARPPEFAQVPQARACNISLTVS